MDAEVIDVDAIDPEEEAFLELLRTSRDNATELTAPVHDTSETQRASSAHTGLIAETVTSPKRGVYVGRIFASRKLFEDACRALLRKNDSSFNGTSIIMQRRGSRLKPFSLAFICDGRGGCFRNGEDRESMCNWRVMATIVYDADGNDKDVVVTGFGASLTKSLPRHSDPKSVACWSEHPLIGSTYSSMKDLERVIKSQSRMPEFKNPGGNQGEPGRLRNMVLACPMTHSTAVLCPFRVRVEQLAESKWRVCFVHPIHHRDCPHKRCDLLQTDDVTTDETNESESSSMATETSESEEEALHVVIRGNQKRRARSRSATPEPPARKSRKIAHNSSDAAAVAALRWYLEAHIDLKDMADGVHHLVANGLDALLLTSVTRSELEEVASYDTPAALSRQLERLCSAIGYRLGLRDGAVRLDAPRIRQLLRDEKVMHVVATLHPALVCQQVKEAFESIGLTWQHFASPPDDFGEMVWLAMEEQEDINLSVTIRVLLRRRLAVWQGALDGKRE